MKQLKILKRSKIALTLEELNQLKGQGRKKNHNDVDSCVCTYYDAPSLTNKNDVSGCSCQCIGY